MIVSIFCKYTKVFQYSVYGGKKVESSKWLITRFYIFSSKCYHLKVKIKFLSFILLTMDAFSNNEATAVVLTISLSVA